MANPKKLSAIVRNELDAAPVIEEFVLSGLSNISGVAIALLPLVNAKLGRRSSVAAVSMAIRRYAAQQRRKSGVKQKFPRYLKITVVRNLFEVACRNNDGAKSASAKLVRMLHKESDDFFIVGQGIFELSFCFAESIKKKVLALLKGCKITSRIDALACVTVDWPIETKDIAGIYYRVTRALARRDIAVQSFHTLGAEMMIFVKDEAVERAHTTIRNLLANSEFE